MTLPYAGADGSKYCPCAAGGTVERGGAAFKVLKGQQKQSGLDGVCKASLDDKGIMPKSSTKRICFVFIDFGFG